MPASPGTFKAGGFAFPTSTGSFAVTGLGFQPQGIIFFGGNQATEDTLLHPSAPGAFFGMAWRDVDSGAVDYQSQAQTTYGVKWRPRPICCLSTGTTTEYEASAVTFDADGFTLTVSVAAPGVRIVHWLAWGNFNSEGKSVGGTSGGQVFDFSSLGYRPFSALGFSMFAASASRDSSAANAIYFSMGTANFPDKPTETEVNAGNTAAGAIAMRAQAGVAEGWTQQYYQVLDDMITPTVASGVAGTWQTNIDHLRPYPLWTSQALRLSLYGNPNRFQLVWWDCEGVVRSIGTPNVGATTTATLPTPLDQVTAALFFGTTGYGSEEELGVNVAYVYGVLTPDYQGVVAFDTGRGNPPADGTKSFYQSRSACFVNSMSPGGGVRVASGAIVGNQVVLTGVVASNAQIGNSFVQLWGREVPLVWTPQVYRRLVTR